MPRSGTSGTSAAGSASPRAVLGRSRSTRHLAPQQRDDHRLSRDDLYLGSSSKRHAAAAPSSSFASPRSTSALHHHHHHHHYPQHHNVVDTDDLPIGMALGSPMHSPLLPAPSRQAQAHTSVWPSAAAMEESPAAQTAAQAPAATATAAAAPTAPPQQTQAPAPATSTTPATGSNSGGGSVQRSKTTRRKLFGLFGGGGGSSSNSSSSSPVVATTPLTGAPSGTGTPTQKQPPTAAASSTAAAAAPAPAERSAPARSGTVRKHHHQHQQPARAEPVTEPAMASPSTSTSTSTPTFTPTSASAATAPQPASMPAPVPTTPLRRADTTQTARSGALRPFLQRTNKDRGMPLGRPQGGMATATMHSSGGSSGSSGSSSNSGISSSGNGTPSFLDHVEIPDIHMERYSVMFGSVLGSGRSCVSGDSCIRSNGSTGHGNGNGQPTDTQEQAPSSASALLARRQATLDRLRTINGRAEEETVVAATGAYLKVGGISGGGLQRRATSPSTSNARSPSYGLFPGQSPREKTTETLDTDVRLAAAVAAAVVPASPRFRSNTSPAAPAAASSYAAELRWRHQQQQLQRYPPNPLRENPIVAEPEALHDDDGDDGDDDDDETTEEGCDGEDAAAAADGMDDKSRRTATPFKPVLQEPQWQMVVPSGVQEAATLPPKEATNKDTISKEAEAAATKAPSPPDNDDDDDDDSALRRAVEQSIARQISVSRLQRQMLVPRRPREAQVVEAAAAAAVSTAAAGVSTAAAAVSTATTATTVSTGSAGTSTPVPAIRSPPSATLPVRAATLRLGRHERLQATKTATPTLVVSSPSSASTSSTSPSASSSSAALSPPYHGYADPAQAPQARHALQLAQNRRSERVVLEAA